MVMVMVMSQMAKHREMQLLEEPLTNYNNGRLLNSRTPRDGRYREVKIVHLLFSCFVVFLVCEFKPHTLRMASNILEKGSSSQVSLGTFPLGTWHLALGTWHLRLGIFPMMSQNEREWGVCGILFHEYSGGRVVLGMTCAVIILGTLISGPVLGEILGTAELSKSEIV